MHQSFHQQYELTKRSRLIVFGFLESTIGKDLNTPVPAFDNKTICHMLSHTAFCYYNWLACFAMHQPPLAIPEDSSLDHIFRLYSQVDKTMASFLQTFREDMEKPISSIHDAMGSVTATPVGLFTHVLTHEFHHKGQIMSMCRILGYPPPDTDVSNFFIGAGR